MSHFSSDVITSQVNDYMEAIHLHALAKAQKIDNDIKTSSQSALTTPENAGLIGRFSSWWSSGSSTPALQARPHAPTAASGAGRSNGGSRDVDESGGKHGELKKNEEVKIITTEFYFHSYQREC